MKLLILIHSLGLGGAERVTANLANDWAARGWDIEIVTIADRSTDFLKIDPRIRRCALGLAGYSGHPLRGLVQNVRRIAAVRRALRRAQPDVAIGMMSNAGVWLALAAIGLPKAAGATLGVEHTHPPNFPLGRLWEPLRWIGYRRLDAVVALTGESANWLRTHTLARRVEIIPNAAIYPLPEQSPIVPPEQFVAPSCRVILGVGRLEREKRFDRLIEAFARIAARSSEWKVVILGAGSERDRLLAQAAAAGLADRVVLPGQVGNVGAWYRRADVFALTSQSEGFPVALVDSMAHGVPAVSFDCTTGPRDIIRDGVDGILVPPADIAAFAASLERLMTDRALRERLAADGITVRARYSAQTIAAAWDDLFRSVLGAHAGKIEAIGAKAVS